MPRRACASLAAMLVLLVGGASAASLGSTPLPAVLARAAVYVKEFERQMTNIVADERYVQELIELEMRAPSGLGPGGPPTPVESRKQRRELRSDFLVVRLGLDGLPVPFRDVYEVDGRPVRDRADRLTKLFLRPTADTIEQAWRVVEEGARYNLGDVRRTVNVPVLPIVVLRAANQERFRFVDRGDATVDRLAVRVVDYEEQRRPTIIRGHENSDLPARGRLWIVPATGQVVKGELNTADGLRMTLSVRYGFDRGADAIVPIEMRDTFVLSRDLQVSGVASYSG